MTEDISIQVARNRRRTNRISSNFVDVETRDYADLSFRQQVLHVAVDADIYTRPLANAGVSGHPDAAQYGSGVGVSGDVRGAWTHKTTLAGTLTYAGRNFIRDALFGRTGRMGAQAIGTDGTAHDPGDTMLGAKSADPYYNYDVALSDGRPASRGLYRFHQHENATQEVGIWDVSGNLVARIADAHIGVLDDYELKVEVTFDRDSVEAVGQASLCKGFTTTLVDTIIHEDPTGGFRKVAFGTSSTSPSSTDTALGAEVADVPAGGDLRDEGSVHTGVLPHSQPSTQPHDITEVGIEDKDGVLAYRAVFDGVTKDSSRILTTSIYFDIR